MELTVLSIAGCPNTKLLAERLEALGVAADAVAWTTVAGGDEAERLGMRGSPTLLVDGVDPFTAPAASGALSCRLYPSRDGRAEGAPSLDALREALFPRAATEPLVLSVPSMTCGKCQSAIEGALGAVTGVDKVTVDLTVRTVTVAYRQPADRAAVTAAVEGAGYEVAGTGNGA